RSTGPRGLARLPAWVVVLVAVLRRRAAVTLRHDTSSSRTEFSHARMPSRTGAVHRACTSAVPPVSHGPAGEPGPRKSLVVPAFAGRRPNPSGRYLTDIDAQPVPVGRIDRDREAEPAALLVEAHPVDLEHRDPASGGRAGETWSRCVSW